MIALRIIYVLNIIVAGQIAISAMFNPERAAATTFGNAYPSTEVMRLVGCLWLGITVLSILGLWKPITFSPVLLLQLIYKGSWLLIVALPALRNDQPFPTGMAIFFVIWVLVLPFLIPWSAWLNGTN
ncbi:MAG: hypothetical protein WBA23_18235 [Tunicatimonas sp.]|uniref:hypothetical protein n=1 Tax=Tunicatimonas sp. TaxID=1940096 RepID=UPI003C763114